ncbi:hypothetical protein AKJ39_02500 [candidate division MSBL1 archaeon SCGC-AAA259J03]|uniref:Uncharacterized protein n=2 Tax=candidate division MSBL1 TaxID=215777 RepID=A0A656YW95_9EURY|nr:hypothetical protein AKJ61_01865 [candidate division MSBL1 archaeon SCGC-AAA259B11]KXA98103.1 hypothetical protein AKJ39_02500 [candidate division MSBL1 archaeon SCGC-AAA259J03]
MPHAASSIRSKGSEGIENGAVGVTRGKPGDPRTGVFERKGRTQGLPLPVGAGGYFRKKTGQRKYREGNAVVSEGCLSRPVTASKREDENPVAGPPSGS